MSEANPPANPEEQPSISLVPEEAASGEGGADAMAIAKETEGRLRKVSSAYKQLQGEMQAMRERHQLTPSWPAPPPSPLPTTVAMVPPRIGPPNGCTWPRLAL